MFLFHNTKQNCWNQPRILPSVYWHLVCLDQLYSLSFYLLTVTDGRGVTAISELIIAVSGTFSANTSHEARFSYNGFGT